MSWSKNITTYPSGLRELWERLYENGVELKIEFQTLDEAKRFQKSALGLRYAYMHTKGHPYETTAGSYTAEIEGVGTSVRLCSVEDTERARLANIALKQAREQHKVQGFKFPAYTLLPGDPPFTGEST